MAAFALGVLHHAAGPRAAWGVALLPVLVLLCVATQGTALAHTVIALVVGTTVLALAFHGRVLESPEAWPDLSYGVYVLAYPIQQTIRYLGGEGIEGLALFGLTLFTVLPIALLSWHLVERPAILIGRRRVRLDRVSA